MVVSRELNVHAGICFWLSDLNGHRYQLQTPQLQSNKGQTFSTYSRREGKTFVR